MGVRAIWTRGGVLLGFRNTDDDGDDSHRSARLGKPPDSAIRNSPETPEDDGERFGGRPVTMDEALREAKALLAELEETD